MEESNDVSDVITSQPTIESNVSIQSMNESEAKEVEEEEIRESENDEKELLDVDGSCLNEDLNEKEKKNSSVEEDFDKNEAKINQKVSDFEVTETDKEAALAVKEEIVWSAEVKMGVKVKKDENVLSFGRGLVETEENVSILEERKGENIEVDEIMNVHVGEKYPNVDMARQNEPLNEDEKNLKVSSFEDVLVEKEGKVSILEERSSKKGEAKEGIIYEVMNGNVKEKFSDFDGAPLNEPSNEERPKVVEINEKVFSFEVMVEKEGTSLEDGPEKDSLMIEKKAKEDEKLSECEPSVSSLDVDEVKEQTLTKESNVRDEKVHSLHEFSVPKDENNLRLNEVLDTKEEATEEKDQNNSPLQGKSHDKVDDDSTEEMDIEEGGPAMAAGKRSAMKRKSSRPKQSQSKKIRARHKLKEDESLCFICFDGGDLVLCDHRSCPKVYHPACVNRDEEYFRAKGQWICGWHICSHCEKSAKYMCCTCTYSTCKECIKEAEFACVRGNKGFCQECIKTVMMIEMNKHADATTDVGVFDDKSGWLYLFKDYWLELNEKLSFTVEELTRASNQLKEPDIASTNNEGTSNKIRADKHKEDSAADNPNNTTAEKSGNSSRRLKRNKEITSSAIKKLKKSSKKPTNEENSHEWASKELLDFVAHMKDGDKSVLSQFDVQALLLAYIKQNNLRDPRKKSQITCDSRLLDLFGKARVGHLEMLKLLEPHFRIKEASPLAMDENQGGVVDPDPNQMDTEGISDASNKTTSDKRRKSCKQTEEKGLASSFDDYAAVDVHNVSLMYLRRNLMEDLLDDADTFNDNVVGAFVRIRISGSASNKDMYRLVQVVGTGKAAEKYNTGRKTTDITLEILNLNRREFITIALISNQEFTEEECKRLRQSVKCGFIDRMTVVEAQEKARVLHTVKVNDWLESEKLRLSNLRDRASEQGRRKEHRVCIEKLQLLSTPEEHYRRLNEFPEIHIDPNEDLDCASTDDENQHTKSQDMNRTPKVAFRDSNRNIAIPINQGNDARQITNTVTPKVDSHTTSCDIGILKNTQPIGDSAQTSNIPPETSSQTRSANFVAPNDTSENEKIWHYQDPSGKVQGPFSLTQLRKWNASNFFPNNLRIWRTSEKQEEDSILLTDALEGKLHNTKQPTNVATLVDSRVSNMSTTNSSSGQSQHNNNNSGPTNLYSRNSENNGRWNGGQNRQNNWNSNRHHKRFQSNNNRGYARQNSYQNSRNQQFPTQQMNMQLPPNVTTSQSQVPQQGNNIDWARLRGAINNVLPSSNVNSRESSQAIASANNSAPLNTDSQFIQPASSQVNATNDQAVSLNAPSAPVSSNLPNASAQQVTNNNSLKVNPAQPVTMAYPAVPNAFSAPVSSNLPNASAQQVTNNNSLKVNPAQPVTMAYPAVPNAPSAPVSSSLPNASAQLVTNNNLVNVNPAQPVNMAYPAVPNAAANMGWGMMAQAPMNMNMNWGAPANMNMAWGPSAQPTMNPNPNLGWVMPAPGMPMQVNPTLNPGWVAPVVGNANPNACWVAPQALANNANQSANWQASTSNAANQTVGDVVAASNPPIGVCNFYYKYGYCKKGASCNYIHS